MMWKVIRCNNCNNPTYIYGDVDMDDMECNMCGSDDCVVLENINDFSSTDMSIILGNELENANYHSFTEIPEGLLRILKDLSVDEEKCKLIMRRFSDLIWDEI